MNIKLKRVYEEPSRDDGVRILVERLWPRGLTKEKAGIDVWMKEIAPSTQLRKWFDHRPERWEEFCRRYREELVNNRDILHALLHHCTGRRVTFVYAAKDEQRNGAVALLQFLSKHSCNFR